MTGLLQSRLGSGNICPGRNELRLKAAIVDFEKRVSGLDEVTDVYVNFGRDAGNRTADRDIPRARLYQSGAGDIAFVGWTCRHRHWPVHRLLAIVQDDCGDGGGNPENRKDRK